MGALRAARRGARRGALGEAVLPVPRREDALSVLARLRERALAWYLAPWDGLLYAACWLLERWSRSESER